MDQILAWGLGLVRAAQSHASPALTALMKGLSFAGSEYCYLIVLPLVYWCVDKRRGLRIGALVFLSTAINLRLKIAFAQPRPYDFDQSLGMAHENTFGLPSNHAQTSTVLAGTAAPLLRRPWGLVLTLALPLFVGLSRVYLGVHFPSDVLAGWALGAALVVADRLWGDRVEALILGLHETLVLALVTAIALGMNALYMKDTSMSGAFFGLAGGALLARKKGSFSVAGPFVKRLLRYLFGMATVVVIYALPKLLLAGLEAGGPPLVRFLRYALLGAWVAAGAPWLFVKLGLAQPEAHSAKEKDGSLISK